LSEISATAPERVIQLRSRSSRPSSPAPGLGGEPGCVRFLVHAEDDAIVSCAKANEVTLLDLDLVGLHDAHQLIVLDKAIAAPAMVLEVDHDAAPLHWMRRHVVDRKRHGTDMLAAFDRPSVAIIDWSDDVLAGTAAVVEDDLGLAVAVGIEQLPDMSQAVPLR